MSIRDFVIAKLEEIPETLL